MYVYDTYRGTIGNVKDRKELDQFIADQEDWLVSHLWMAPNVKVEAVIVVVTQEMIDRLV